MICDVDLHVDSLMAIHHSKYIDLVGLYIGRVHDVHHLCQGRMEAVARFRHLEVEHLKFVGNL